MQGKFERDPKPVTQMLLELYRPRFMEQFKNHPKGAELVEMLCQGDNPKELVDLWFAEAEMYNWEALMRPSRGPAGQISKDGKNVVFAIHKGEKK